MAVYSFNGSDLLMMLRGAVNLLARRRMISMPLMFSVPDGDTGTNMYQTIEASQKKRLKLTQTTSDCWQGTLWAQGEIQA